MKDGYLRSMHIGGFFFCIVTSSLYPSSIRNDFVKMTAVQNPGNLQILVSHSHPLFWDHVGDAFCKEKQQILVFDAC